MKFVSATSIASISVSRFRASRNDELRAVFLILTLAVALLLEGCGYTMLTKANLPFDTVRIGRIKNTTHEPKLEDMLYVALTQEFMKRGVRVADSSPADSAGGMVPNEALRAGNLLEGTINVFIVNISSEKQNFAASYKTEIKGDFTFTGEDGKVRTFKGISSPFYESFDSQTKINDITASKENEDAQAIGNLAVRLVSELMYR